MACAEALEKTQLPETAINTLQGTPAGLQCLQEGTGGPWSDKLSTDGDEHPHDMEAQQDGVPNGSRRHVQKACAAALGKVLPACAEALGGIAGG